MNVLPDTHEATPDGVIDDQPQFYLPLPQEEAKEGVPSGPTTRRSLYIEW